jgi:hypothetical protein
MCAGTVVQLPSNRWYQLTSRVLYQYIETLRKNEITTQIQSGMGAHGPPPARTRRSPSLSLARELVLVTTMCGEWTLPTCHPSVLSHLYRPLGCQEGSRQGG